MKFTASQRKEIYARGRVRIPGLVGRAEIDAALREINTALGGSSSYGKNGMPQELDPRRLWSDLEGSPAVSSLFHGTPVKRMVESLIGEGEIDPDLQRTVLLRFPQDPSGRERTAFHVDGFEYGGGIDARGARKHGHTIAVEVLLSDAPRDWMGNFVLIPGSHRALERHFQENSADVERHEMPDVALGAPESVKGRAGDVVFYHYQIAHSAFAFRNLSPHIHYAAFFWVKRAGHDARWREALTDLWLEWPGMRDVLPRRGGR